MTPPGNASAHRKFRGPAQDQIATEALEMRRALVGVIADEAALERALRLRQPPDLFELRLDALALSLGKVETTLAKLRAPIILTARHPAEGGCHALGANVRRKLFCRFLSRASWIDLELRSVPSFGPLLAAARAQKISLIISSHFLGKLPAAETLRNQLQGAIAAGADIFKVATRTNTTQELDQLLAFFAENSAAFPIAAMGLGLRGAESRRRLLQLGSVLNYVSLGKPNAPGQLSLSQLRRARRAILY